ncbi:MAG: 7-cyano-7-deazaguanine synthase QueC [Acidobacteria bacterium]|nr:7-cyano-7-deazaguanine synthase QueC [Acidobacteriota bacterium]
MEVKEKCVVLLSGGMDSLATLAVAIDQNFEPYLIHLNYGQKTEEAELKSFNKIASFYGIKEENRIICHTNFFSLLKCSSLIDKESEIPKGELNSRRIPSTYVPFRNGLLLSLAVSYAEKVGCKTIFFGAVSADSSGYPDCTEEFINKFRDCAEKGTAYLKDLKIVAPFVNMKKSQILSIASRLGAPLHYSWSCYKRNDLACGECDSCLLRLRAFEEIGSADPIPYAKFSKDKELPKVDKLVRLKRLLTALTSRT